MRERMEGVRERMEGGVWCEGEDGGRCEGEDGGRCEGEDGGRCEGEDGGRCEGEEGGRRCVEGRKVRRYGSLSTGIL